MRIAASLITSLVLSLGASACATSADTDLSSIDGEAALAGKLSFWQAPDGQFHFHVKSGNGAILLTSEAYTSRTASIAGALSVLANGVDPASYAVVPAKTGFVVHLLAANQQIVAVSEVYASKSNANRAVESFVRAITSYLDKRESLVAGARTEVTAGATGKYHFNFFAKNGEIVLTSEAYDSEAAAYNGAFAAQAAGAFAAAYDVKENVAGGFYFTVQASNGEIVGVSEQYASKQGAQAGAAALQALLPAITIL